MSSMTDITRLLASLKRRSAHAKEFGDSITFVKLKDIDALVEALEKAQQRITEQDAELEREREKSRRVMSRIFVLEESHAQVIHSRDHYKRMSEEGLKQLAESRTVTVKLPHLPDDCDRADANFYYMKALADAGIKWEAE
ncbi:hypothetical protein [Klebsiella aerogenes]|uniref:hypothetical protein n=1 Tax=Klebsiella aerogenes TaxID=548 RepID=UPI000CE95653|nr:hypothetical protein [Klebsiella aerogenes]AVE99153.1 hypothetical protein AM441_11160 [Klebsiella aerogenes]